ncbi:hypothetical protein HK104_000927 [Borealophlyctis nickersoniae]|nr:hypothetical protein HK104_000927 [Borealophlyctis nickersoniae]
MHYVASVATMVGELERKSRLQQMSWLKLVTAASVEGVASVVDIPPSDKVPRLVVLLKEIKQTDVDAGATFKDPTGEIHGTIHKKVLDEYGEHLCPGAVLELIKMSVFRPTQRAQYLNITPANVKNLFTVSGDPIGFGKGGTVLSLGMGTRNGPSVDSGREACLSGGQEVWEEFDEDIPLVANPRKRRIGNISGGDERGTEGDPAPKKGRQSPCISKDDRVSAAAMPQMAAPSLSGGSSMAGMAGGTMMGTGTSDEYGDEFDALMDDLDTSIFDGSID